MGITLSYHKTMNWVRQRVLGATLAAASTLTFISLVTPWWADFFFDIIMVGLIALAARMHRSQRIHTTKATDEFTKPPETFKGSGRNF